MVSLVGALFEFTVGIIVGMVMGAPVGSPLGG